MICIECTHPVSSLYTVYSPTNIRSTACPNCHKFADKYIESDGIVTAIDLLLLKPQAFRHVIFNVLTVPGQEDSLHKRTKRMWLLITLFDVYLTCARAEKSSSPSQQFTQILGLPLTAQYIIFLLYCVTDTLLMHETLRFLSYKWLGWNKPNALSTAIVISSYSKLFPVLVLLWPYDIPMAASVVSWAVNLNIVEVLTVLMGCTYTKAITMTAISTVVRSIGCHLVLKLATSSRFTSN